MDRTRASLTVLVLLALALALGGGGGIGYGASLFVVLHEPTKDDESFSKLAIQIQDSASTVAKEIAAAKWQALVLDDDAVDGNKQPLPLLVKLGVHGSITDSHRELLSVSPPDKLVARETIPPGATAESVLAMMRARGKR